MAVGLRRSMNFWIWRFWGRFSLGVGCGWGGGHNAGVKEEKKRKRLWIGVDVIYICYLLFIISQIDVGVVCAELVGCDV
jgi:hypothetical protein